MKAKAFLMIFYQCSMNLHIMFSLILNGFCKCHSQMSNMSSRISFLERFKIASMSTLGFFF